MTTICWDGEYMAADKGAWKQGHIDKITKLHRLTVDGSVALYACLGIAAFAHMMMHHLADPTRPMPDWRDYAGDTGIQSGSEPCGVMIFPFGVIYEVDCMGGRIRLEGHGTRGVYAAGGGREMALGALLAGASAQRAVEIAIEFSDYGGHGVTVLKHDQGEGNG